MASYQTGPCSQNKSVSRYYALGYTKKKLGIDYDACTNYVNYGQTTPLVNLYGGQLPSGTGPSVHFKIFRNMVPGVTSKPMVAARVQVTYYVKYRGTKGTGSISQ